jgi:hypothetical protein
MSTVSPYDYIYAFIKGYCFAHNIEAKDHVKIFEEDENRNVIKTKEWKELFR